MISRTFPINTSHAFTRDRCSGNMRTRVMSFTDMLMGRVKHSTNLHKGPTTLAIENLWDKTNSSGLGKRNGTFWHGVDMLWGRQ